jgi:predicted AAA+ superfamily ATPase
MTKAVKQILDLVRSNVITEQLVHLPEITSKLKNLRITVILYCYRANFGQRQ